MADDTEGKWVTFKSKDHFDLMEKVIKMLDDDRNVAVAQVMLIAATVIGATGVTRASALDALNKMLDKMGVEMLAPCPFCGGAAEWHDITEADETANIGGSCIVCTRCQACGPVQFGEKDTIIEQWNRRSDATLTALRQRVVEVVGPFAATAEADIGESEADADLFRSAHPHNHAPQITVGHFRAARALINEIKETTDGH